jgi:hypothetical protein
MPCQLGRAELPSPSFIRQEGDRLRVGHTGYAFDGEEGKVMAAQVCGYPNVDEPVIRFTYDPYSVTGQIDGFYVCVSTSVDWVKLAANLFSWEADLERIPSWQIPLWELVSGGTVRSNAHSIAIGATIPTVGAPVGAFSATPGFETAATRTGEEGAVPVFYDATTPTTYRVAPSWKVAAADVEKGAARLEVYGGPGWDVVVGRQVQNLPTAWRISNSLVRCTATLTAAKTELSIEHHDGTGWDAAKVWQLTQDTSYTALALAPTSLSVFKNAADEVRIQLGAGITTSVTLDLRLRRGSRMVEGYLSHPTVTALGIRRATNEAATALSTTCGLRATSDSDGNKYVVCTPLALAGTDTTIGAIRVSSGTFPFGVGAAVGGTVGTGFGETMGEASGYMAAINHHQNAVAV